jgi:biofilm PGA synthesis N-glycosyltransferase PgaC
VPERLGQFVQQRKRWSRGMIEAMKHHPALLIKPRMTTLFIWWNVFFPWLDFTYTVFFMPGLVLALFGLYWIAGPMTLALLPMALIMNFVMYRIGRGMFVQHGLRVRHNFAGFLMYAAIYSFILQPACVAGYLSELLGLRKTWATK